MPEKATTTMDDVWATINKIAAQLEKTEIVIAARQDRTEKLMARLGGRFGDIAEATLIPFLEKKFEEHNFTFGKTGRCVKFLDKRNDIYTEVDALLENGSEAMAVEVKTKLETDDIKDHVERMEKLRKYADLRDDKRKLYGAIAAMVVDKSTRTYALKQGFYVIEPSGEDVNITPPLREARAW